MSDRTRMRGDDYPISPTFRVDGVAIDLTGAVVKFSYENVDNAVKTITGVADGVEVGLAVFTPDKGVDFQVAGIFTYDIQRVDADGFTYTHQKGTLIIDDDVTA